MTLPQKTATVLGALVIALILGILGAYWRSNTVPNPPEGLPPNSVFLWAPHVGLPGAKRGWWLTCSERSGQDHCKITETNGTLEYEGEFIPYYQKGPVPKNDLDIDALKSGEHKLWVEGALVPLIVLKNGEILIPAVKYEDGRRLLDQVARHP
jgi:hypothetical protein